MSKPGDYRSMKQALVAALLNAGGQIEVDFTDVGEAALSDVEVVVERTAKGAVIRLDRSALTPA